MQKLLKIVTLASACAGWVITTEASEARQPVSPALAGTELAPALDQKQGLQGWWQLDGTIKRLDSKYRVAAQMGEPAEGLALLREPNGTLLLATLAGEKKRPTLLQWNSRKSAIATLAQAEPTDFSVESLCLQRDQRGNIYLFLVDERGSAQQWWLRDGDGQPTVHKVRDGAVAPNVVACATDAKGNLFLAEEDMAIWQYASNPEAAPGRELVDMVPPFGSLAGGAAALAVVGQTLVAVDADHKRARLYTRNESSWRVWPLESQQLAALDEPEQLHAWWDGQQLQLVLRDDETGLHHHLALSLPARFPMQKLKPATSGQPMVAVKAKVQTESVARFGDAADDPAIWVHPKQPELSRVLGTDKKLGLEVFDMDGRRLQHLAVGRINNVDLRYDFDWGDGMDDIAVGTQRDNNSLSVYRINAASGEVHHRSELPTGLEEIYGICLYQNKQGETYAIANGKSGDFEQYRLRGNDGNIEAELVRTFAVKTQPEGCVADDGQGQLYVGEEDHGLWTLAAEPDPTSELMLIIETGDVVVADLEGVALYPQSNARYLVISSQGDHSYVVMDAEPPYRVRGKFQVVADAESGIDGSSETDGLEVTARPLGPAFPAGMLVVQDGHNVMPEAPQNFKYISWQDIAEALNLNE